MQQNAKDNNVYAAMVQGRRGQLYVRIGGNDDDWHPEMSRYANYRDYAHGNGWKVWVHLPGDPPVQQAPKKPPFENFPTYRKPETIVVPDQWLTLD